MDKTTPIWDPATIRPHEKDLSDDMKDLDVSVLTRPYNDEKERGKAVHEYLLYRRQIARKLKEENQTEDIVTDNK